jgi:hypothetical protein
MNAHERRQYETLLRLRDFGQNNRDLFASPIAQEAFASVSAAIDELTATDLLKRSASMSARADRKLKARRALGELLVKVGQFVRVLRARGQNAPPFLLPAMRTDQDLLSAARQFVRDAAPFDAEFSAHGVGPTVIAAAAGALEAAVRDRGLKQADRTAAATRIRDLLAAAFLDVRRLDLIVDNELANDNNPLRQVWKLARRVQRARAARGSSTGGVTESSPAAAPTPTPTDDSSASSEGREAEHGEDVPASEAVDVPKVATVIRMPSREAA